MAHPCVWLLVVEERFLCWHILVQIFIVDVASCVLASLFALQSQYQDNYVAGPPLGKEGEAPREV